MSIMGDLIKRITDFFWSEYTGKRKTKILSKAELKEVGQKRKCMWGRNK